MQQAPIWIFVLAVAAAGHGSAVAQRADPMRSPACAAALNTLAAEETATLERGQRTRGDAVPAALRMLQARAARVCLGDAAPGERSGARLQPPVSVPSVRVPAPRAAAPTPALTLPVVPPPASPRPWITSCDATGCWGSDGLRYQRHAGPMVLGPHGVCTLQGATLNCP